MRGLAAVPMALLLALPSGASASDEEPMATGAFDPVGELNEARALHTATLLDDGRVLVVGGVSCERGRGYGAARACC